MTKSKKKVASAPKKKRAKASPLACMCVDCGGKGTKGSFKHPYCTKCFKKRWNNDYDAYFRWLGATH